MTYVIAISGSYTVRRDTKEHNKQKQQKYNLLKLIFLYLLSFCHSVPFSDVDDLMYCNYGLCQIYSVFSQYTFFDQYPLFQYTFNQWH